MTTTLSNEQRALLETEMESSVDEHRAALAAALGTIDAQREQIEQLKGLNSVLEADCHDGMCDACPKCCDAYRKRIAALEAEVRSLREGDRRRTDDKEVEHLYELHGKLVHRKLIRPDLFTEADASQLRMLRWMLDRIQDAQTGEALDELEELVRSVERRGSKIDEFVSHAKKLAR